MEIECSTPTKQEIIRAIKQLKKGKAAGPDRISSEALKADARTSTEMLHKWRQTSKRVVTTGDS